MDIKTLENLISTRGMVKIGNSHGWGAGRIGIALGYRPLYHSAKVGFVDENGRYTGEYTVVPVSAVEQTDAGRLTLEEAWAEFERDFRGHVVRVQFPEPDRDAGRLTLEEALEEAHTEWQTGEPAVVRIRYVDGTTEEIRNIPRGEMAAGIYAEAVDNDRVVKAELVRGDGTVAAKYPQDPHAQGRGRALGVWPPHG